MYLTSEKIFHPRTLQAGSTVPHWCLPYFADDDHNDQSEGDDAWPPQQTAATAATAASPLSSPTATATAATPTPSRSSAGAAGAPSYHRYKL